MVFKVFSVDIWGYNGSEIQCCRKNTFSCIKLLKPITEHVDSGQHLSLLMLMSLKSSFARLIPQTVLFLESKSRGLHPLWTAQSLSLPLSLSPLQCCWLISQSSWFTHLAINLGPRGPGCTGCEPGCLLGWYLWPAHFCFTSIDTDEMCDVFFLFRAFVFDLDRHRLSPMQSVPHAKALNLGQAQGTIHHLTSLKTCRGVGAPTLWHPGWAFWPGAFTECWIGAHKITNLYNYGFSPH